MIYFVITIISVLIGYYLGSRNSGSDNGLVGGKEWIVNGVKMTKEGLKQLTTPQTPTGQIHSPSPSEIAFRNRPQREKEGVQAMKETLDNIPELVEHKKRVEKLRKEGLIV